jgi:hypothetical protein
MLLGASGFWVPDAVLHAIQRFNFSGRDIRILTLLMPLTFLVTFSATRWVMRKNGPPGRIGGPIVVGVWLFGGLFMMLNETVAGSFKGISWAVMSTILSLFPPYTFMLATYDGALGALLLVTVVSLLVLVLPSTWRWLRVGLRRKPNFR